MTDKKQSYLTLADAPGLRKAYEKAVKDQKKSFMYRGHELLTSYAKYLLEYMDSFTQKVN